LGVKILEKLWNPGLDLTCSFMKGKYFSHEYESGGDGGDYDDDDDINSA
jgi:hypothetical protein